MSLNILCGIGGKSGNFGERAQHGAVCHPQYEKGEQLMKNEKNACHVSCGNTRDACERKKKQIWEQSGFAVSRSA